MLAIIPARYGSKGIRKKNIKLFCGKPLIAWSIIAAKKSKLVDRVIVSTDSTEIANISKKYGAEVPFMRPKYLATDKSKAIETYIYTVKKLKQLFNLTSDDFVVLQPTSPLRNSSDIDKAIRVYFKEKADSVLSCVETEIIPFTLFELDGSAIKIEKKSKLRHFMNRQEIKKSYFMVNGAIYVLNYNKIKNNNSYFLKNTHAYIMPKDRSIDINNIDDFKFAEILKK